MFPARAQVRGRVGLERCGRAAAAVLRCVATPTDMLNAEDESQQWTRSKVTAQ